MTGELYALLCAFTWAWAVILFRKSGLVISPVALGIFKNSIALTLFLITLLVLDISFFPPDVPLKHWVILIISGILGIYLGDTLFLASLRRLGAGLQAIVDCGYSPFVLLAAFFYLGEPITLKLIFAMLMIAGAIVIGTWQPRQIRVNEDKKVILEGVLIGILAIFCVAMAIVIAKPILEISDPFWVLPVRLSAGITPLIIQGWIREKNRREIIQVFKPGQIWKIAIPASILGSYLSMILWILGMKHTTASNAGILNQTSSIFVLILAAFFLKEKLTLRKVIAILMAFSGAVMIVLVKN